MLALKYLLMLLGVGLFGSSAALAAYDVYMATKLRALLARTPVKHASGLRKVSIS